MNEKERKMKVKSLSPVQLFATPWTVALQAPPSMGYSRQEYWSGVPLPSLRYRAVRWYKGKGTGFRAQSSEIKFKSIA